MSVLYRLPGSETTSTTTIVEGIIETTTTREETITTTTTVCKFVYTVGAITFTEGKASLELNEVS
jgi:hypothetical protein